MRGKVLTSESSNRKDTAERGKGCASIAGAQIDSLN
jgi:hypothetical protein